MGSDRSQYWNNGLVLHNLLLTETKTCVWTLLKQIKARQLAKECFPSAQKTTSCLCYKTRTLNVSDPMERALEFCDSSLGTCWALLSELLDCVLQSWHNFLNLRPKCFNKSSWLKARICYPSLLYLALFYEWTVTIDPMNNNSQIAFWHYWHQASVHEKYFLKRL